MQLRFSTLVKILNAKSCNPYEVLYGARKKIADAKKPHQIDRVIYEENMRVSNQQTSLITLKSLFSE